MLENDFEVDYNEFYREGFYQVILVFISFSDIIAGNRTMRILTYCYLKRRKVVDQESIHKKAQMCRQK